MTGSIDPGSTPEMSKNLSSDLKNSQYIEINKGKHLCSIECRMMLISILKNL